MKRIEVELWELTKDEVKELPEGIEVLVYNSLIDHYFIERSGKECIANYKYASDKLVYFVFEKPNLNK